MSLLRDRLFSSVALGHLTVDFLNGSRAVLVAYLSTPLGLNNAAVGVFSTIYVVSGSLTQPIFGWLTDRIGPRWVASVGIFWMAAFYGAAMLISSKTSLIFLVLASLGSAAFHPAGTMQATLRGRTHYSGHETSAAAYFFVFGQLGLFFGPVVSGPMLEEYNLVGMLPFAVLAIPAGLFAARQLRKPAVAVRAQKNDPKALLHSVDRPKTGATLLFFALLAAFQAWAQQNMITFIPKYLSDMGQSAATYGLIAALFMGGSALGNLLGGRLADRYGKRKVAFIGLTLAGIPLYFVSLVGWSPSLYLLIPLAGALTGATHSIIVVLAQRIIPGGMALASGLILGFMFTSGALGTLLSGPVADLWGFPVLFQFTAGITLAAAILALWLQKS